MTVAVMNIARVLDESKAGKAYSGKLRAVVEKWQKQIAEVQTKHTQTQERIQKSAGVGTEETLARLRRDLRLFDMELQSLQERQRFDVETQRESFRGELLARVRAVAEALAKEKDLSLVLAMTGRELVYAADGVDVTDAVMAQLTD